ncbi:hypothetical protein TVAG_164520 [Trichomonas vaginalis G3]|uniref:Selenium-dependent hydroxylase accessory protein YqeC n=1 Tax=Trichomonas vaginalis (strain ATCC PRA-98 / G3) TaxID=412133 RepID=A2E1Z3_TRIV3|nr:putative selenium-dependent hydroxylase accessory protein YqeC family [Trichomonas vaginalis G3]EAY13342.1 hypothetical protein TVAG_164520 [Trichomonas vaginalis G3]KAI5540389.1 putative selenium-dependent hydroxylase accessory protein YqeC family [Trichomonas vaginalis G3]|eukprot:XP_001325565.1 hypothetical protein [Trichomonas vaginalis G3]
MKFWLYSHQTKTVKESDNILSLLSLGNHEVISVVGGGGKTHTVFEISHELVKQGKKVILCTTTAMMFPEEPVYTGNNIEEIKSMFKNSLVIVGTRIGPKKMGPPDSSIYDQLDSICDYLVIEADGSRQLPLKFPRSHEPVLHPRSTLVIGLAGIDSFGAKLEDVCHKPPTAVELLHKTNEDIIDEKDIAFILESEDGQMKNVKCRYIAIINKVDDDTRYNNAILVAQNLKNHDCIFSTYDL